jgi:hypothetical protein
MCLPSNTELRNYFGNFILKLSYVAQYQLLIVSRGAFIIHKRQKRQPNFILYSSQHPEKKLPF